MLDELTRHYRRSLGIPVSIVDDGIVYVLLGEPRDELCGSVGSMSIGVVNKVFYIQTMFIEENQRRNGHARRFITASENAARELGCTKLVVDDVQKQDLADALARYGYTPLSENEFFISTRTDWHKNL